MQCDCDVERHIRCYKHAGIEMYFYHKLSHMANMLEMAREEEAEYVSLAWVNG